MFNLSGEKLAWCGVAAALIVGGTCLVVWPRQMALLEEAEPGEPPTPTPGWRTRAVGVLMALCGAAVLAAVLGALPPDPDPVLF